MYRVSSELTRKKHLLIGILYYTIFGTLLLCVSLWVLWRGTTHMPNNMIKRFFIYFLIVSLIIIAIFFFVADIISIFWLSNPPRSAMSLDITDDGVIIEYNDGKKILYPFSTFTDYIRIYVSFILSPNSFHYDSLWDFLENGTSRILNVLRKGENAKLGGGVYISIKKLVGKKESELFSLDIYISAIGGQEGIREMLDDWKRNYEKYLKKVGKYEEVVKKEAALRTDGEKERRKALQHIKYLFGLIIFSLVSLIYFLLQFVHSPVDSQCYKEAKVLFEIDLYITVLLITIAIIRINILWRKVRKVENGLRK